MPETQDGKEARIVAVINLFAGMAIMLILLQAVALGSEGRFISAMGLLLISIGIVWHRIHRVFQTIK